MHEHDKVNILMVDDQPAKLLSYETILGELGENLIKAGSGREALEHLLKTDIAIVLMDVSMPELDGFELAEIIHQHPRYQKTAIIFVSAVHLTDLDQLRGYRHGAVDYLAVPVVPELLRAKVSVFAELYRKTRQLEQLNNELERRVTERTEELQQKIEETTQLNATLRRTNEELQQFAYVASHDLQEPLRMVLSFVQLMAKRYQGKLDTDADEFIGYAVEGAQRMEALIHALLAYSRVGTAGQEFTLTDCEAVLTQTLDDLRKAVEESGAEVTHDPLPQVRADTVQLRQVFQNLLSNAIKFRNQIPPHIHVSARQEGEHWLFSVQDNGIGINPEYTERIFVIFQRLHTRRENPDGTGIGLAICKKVIERHGGRIWVESQPGAGATFFFTLPQQLFPSS